MKKIVLALSLILISLTGAAKHVDQDAAQRVAVNFWNAHRDAGVSVIGLQPTLVATGYDAFYIFANSYGGFVIVAADDRVQPILAYSFSSPVSSRLNPEVRYILGIYQQQIDWIRANVADIAADSQWTLYSTAPSGDPVPLTAVAPLLSTTWNQDEPYNDLCPYDDTAQMRTYTGCVATAMAQVMKYYNHPLQGNGLHSFQHDDYGTLSANFGNTTYDWSHMPNALTSVSSQQQITAVATLMYHVGVAMDMMYGTTGSGAYIENYGSSTLPCAENALSQNFRYQPVSCIYREDYTDLQWSSQLVDELDAARPILYAGEDSSTGHCFVVDGYNTNATQFHINWGWGGYYDGYFSMSNLTPDGSGIGASSTGSYNLNQRALIEIIPDSSASGEDGDDDNPDVPVNEDCIIASFPYTLTFDDTTQYGCIGIIDANGDTNSWSLINGYGVNSSICAFIQYAVMADDYLTLPAIATPGNYVISWKAKVYNSAYPETYSVYAGESQIFSETLTATSFVDRSAVFSVAQGDTVVPMFRYTSNDMYYFFLDNIVIQQAASSYTVTLASNNTAWGTVSGGGSYNLGDTATITAIPASGYHFVQWSDGSEETPRDIVVNQDINLTATFAIDIVGGDTISYCDTNSFATSIGGGGIPIYWGISLTPSMLAGHNYLRSVMFYAYESGIYTLTLYEGGTSAPGSQIHTQTAAISATNPGWNAIDIDDIIAIDATQKLWIVLYASNLNYPAAACAIAGSNADWISVDGSNWMHLAQAGIEGAYSWMIKAVTSDDPGQTPAPTVYISGPAYTATGTSQTFTATTTGQPSVSWSLQGANPSSASGNSVTATWSTPGTYNIVATATNTAGSASDTMQVEVVSCAPVTAFPYTIGFDSNDISLYTCWTTIDADGDGYSWDTESFTGAIGSASYINNVGALTPDNWLVGPQMQLATGSGYSLSWIHAAIDSVYCAEHYGVYVSTSGTATSDFTLLQDYTLSSHLPATMTLDLSQYAGQNIHIAFRHYGVTDVYWLIIDDITVSQSAIPDQYYTITVTPNVTSWGTVTGSGSYIADTVITISASANSGYHFVQWNDGVTDNPRTVTVTGNATYIAIFETDSVAQTYQLSVLTSDSTMGTVSGSGTYNDGSTATISATAFSGNIFSMWNDGVTDNPRTVIVNSDTTFIAIFDTDPVEQHTVTVLSNNEEWGSVEGSGIYNYGTIVTISAQPFDGYRFVQWNDGDTLAAREITVTSDVTFIATFAPEGDPNAISDIQNPESNIHIYPNPASNIVTIEWPEADGQWTMEIVDVNGRIVGNHTTTLSGTRATIDVTDLPSGTYFLRLHTPTFTSIRKITINE